MSKSRRQGPSDGSRKRDLRARIAALEAELEEERSRRAELEAEKARAVAVAPRPSTTSRLLDPVRFVRSLWP